MKQGSDINSVCSSQDGLGSAAEMIVALTWEKGTGVRSIQKVEPEMPRVMIAIRVRGGF